MLDLGKMNFICPVKTELVGEKLSLMGCSLSGSPWSSEAQGHPCSSTWSISYPVSPWPQSGEGCCSHPLPVGLCLLLNTFHRGCTSSSGDLAVPHSGDRLAGTGCAQPGQPHPSLMGVPAVSLLLELGEGYPKPKNSGEMWPELLNAKLQRYKVVN